jgi:nitroreductase
MDALQAIETRKSKRNYLRMPVEIEKLEILAKAGSGDPKTGDFHISVITNAGLLDEIDEKGWQAMKKSAFLKLRAELPGYRPLYGAPVLFLISSPDIPFKETNTACAATNITIAATALGLASCYVISATRVFIDDTVLQKQAEVPDGFMPMCGVLIGYGAGEDKYPAPFNPSVGISYYR